MEKCKIDTTQFNLLPNERLESFWDTLWLGIRTFLCFKISKWSHFGATLAHFGATLGHSGGTWEPLGSHFGTLGEALWGTLAGTSGLVWGHIGMTLGHFGVSLVRLRVHEGHLEVTLV